MVVRRHGAGPDRDRDRDRRRDGFDRFDRFRRRSRFCPFRDPILCRLLGYPFFR